MKEVKLVEELQSLLESEDNEEKEYEIAVDKSNMCDLEEIVDVLPDYVLMQDNYGNLVYSIENLEGVTAKVIRTKMIGYGVRPSDVCMKALHGDKKAFDSLPDFNYVLSTVDNTYIGDEDTFNLLMSKFNITYFRGISKDSKSSSIGFSGFTQEWFGWSHRAIHGFKIGDVVSEGDITATSGYDDEYLLQHPWENRALPVGFTAYTLNDAKRMAKAFADAVS